MDYGSLIAVDLDTCTRRYMAGLPILYPGETYRGFIAPDLKGWYNVTIKYDEAGNIMVWEDKTVEHTAVTVAGYRVYVGRYYKTRNGNKVYVIGFDTDGSIIITYDTGSLGRINNNGFVSRYSDKCPSDLMEEWVERKPVETYYFNVYTNEIAVRKYHSFEEANAGKAPKRKGIIKHTYDPNTDKVTIEYLP